MQEREIRGGRPNRRTESGYWKATGSPTDVYDSRNLRIGRKKTMVFYEGRAPYGKKTTWKMNEYKMYQTHHHPSLPADPQVCFRPTNLVSLALFHKFSRVLKLAINL